MTFVSRAPGRPVTARQRAGFEVIVSIYRTFKVKTERTKQEYKSSEPERVKFCVVQNSGNVYFLIFSLLHEDRKSPPGDRRCSYMAGDEGARGASDGARRRPSAQRGGSLACATLRSPCGTPGCCSARAIGSAGERLVHTEEVTGSIPVSPTPSYCRSAPVSSGASSFRAIRVPYPGIKLRHGMTLV